MEPVKTSLLDRRLHLEVYLNGFSGAMVDNSILIGIKAEPSCDLRKLVISPLATSFALSLLF